LALKKWKGFWKTAAKIHIKTKGIPKDAFLTKFLGYYGL